MDLVNLEQQRKALESNLQKLRESLRHWQTWEAEYEGLKEEFQQSKDDPTADELVNIAKTYEGDLVNEKEIRDLSGLDKDSPRSATQIIGLIQRRQEYVQKNIETVQRQYFEAEAKSEELAFAAANQNPGGDAGLPLTEIHEELDEDGNVISSRLSQPEESTANIITSLRKAGLKEDDLDDTPEIRPKAEDLKPAITNASPVMTPTVGFEKRDNSDTIHSRNSSGGAEDLERPSIRKKSVSFTADTKPPEERPRPESEDGKKSVSFAEKVAVMPAAPPPDTRSVSFSPMVEEIPPQVEPVSPDLTPLPEQAHKVVQSDTGNIAIAMTDQGATGGAEDEEVILPENESPEDARTRREMLEYHLNEVGNVVAQIDLEEPDVDMEDDDEDDSSSFFTTSEYLEDEDTPYTTGLSESEGSEDEFGRTKRRMVTPEYRKQMEELEQKLIGNMGPEPKDEDIAAADADLDPKDVRRLVVRDKRNSTSSASSDNSEKKTGKKRVSFAESIDVAEPGSPPLKAQKHQEGENVEPVSSNVTERATAASHSLPQRISNEALSRFKKDRAQPLAYEEEELSTTPGTAVEDMEVDETSLGPPGATISSTLKERTPSAKPAVAPSIEDMDSLSCRRELASEYYRRRNDLIQHQGGFTNSTADEDNELGELMEERDGKLKKVSKFKAARLKP